MYVYQRMVASPLIVRLYYSIYIYTYMYANQTTTTRMKIYSISCQ
jgi:hypothetical protein